MMPVNTIIHSQGYWIWLTSVSNYVQCEQHWACKIILIGINVIEYRRGKQNQRNGQQDEEKQNKNTTEYVLNTTMRKQIQIT
jgi:hypothetical protein